MAPILFTIPILSVLGPSRSVFGFGIMLVLAFISSTWLAWWRAGREGLDPEVILDMAFWVFLFGLIGARLFYCIEYWGRDIQSLWEALQYWKGGIVYYGGIVGGIVGVLLLPVVPPVSAASLLDAWRRRSPSGRSSAASGVS